MDGVASSHADFNFWVAHTDATFTPTIHTLLKFDKGADAFTTFSTTTANPQIDGTYVVRLTQSEATAPSTTYDETTIRVIYDACAPNMQVTGSLSASYDH